jgi:hypothetical protein
MKYLVKEDYLAKAKTLPEPEQERILSRMTGKLPKRLDKDKLTREEAIAIQMEIEDDQLNEWRQRMHELQAKAVAKAEKEARKEAKSKKGASRDAVGDRKKAADEAKTGSRIVVETPVVKKAGTARPASLKSSGNGKAPAAPAVASGKPSKHP